MEYCSYVIFWTNATVNYSSWTLELLLSSWIQLWITSEANYMSHSYEPSETWNKYSHLETENYNEYK